MNNMFGIFRFVGRRNTAFCVLRMKSVLIGRYSDIARLFHVVRCMNDF